MNLNKLCYSHLQLTNKVVLIMYVNIKNTIFFSISATSSPTKGFKKKDKLISNLGNVDSFPSPVSKLIYNICNRM
jgi:hypothetical protein